jgi:hypothetical protein
MAERVVRSDYETSVAIWRIEVLADDVLFTEFGKSTVEVLETAVVVSLFPFPLETLS